MSYQTALDALRNNPVVFDSHSGKYIIIHGLVEIRGAPCAINDLTGWPQTLNLVERDENHWVLTRVSYGIARFYGKGSTSEDVRVFNESCVFEDNHIKHYSIF